MSPGEGKELKIAPHKRRIYNLDGNPGIGFSLASREKGEEIDVAIKDFFYDGMGSIYQIYVAQIWGLYLEPFCRDEGIEFDLIRNATIQIDSKNEVDISINDTLITSTLVNKSVEKFDLIYSNDVIGISKIEFENLEIHPSKAIIHFFKLGERSGIFFDFTPLHPDFTELKEGLDFILAPCYTILLHPEIADYYPKIKKQLFEKGWFPFIRIYGENFTKLLEATFKNEDTQAIEEKIIFFFTPEKITYICDQWMNNSIFKEHEVIIRQGIERYNAGDYVSAIHILTPRAEGLLRYLYAKNQKKKPNTKDLRELLKTSIQGDKVNIYTFLPLDFDEYLRTVYFRDFDVSGQKLDHSRHSTAHGVTDPNEMNQKNAFKMIMIFDQIFYYIS